MRQRVGVVLQACKSATATRLDAAAISAVVRAAGLAHLGKFLSPRHWRGRRRRDGGRRRGRPRSRRAPMADRAQCRLAARRQARRILLQAGERRRATSGYVRAMRLIVCPARLADRVGLRLRRLLGKRGPAECDQHRRNHAEAHSLHCRTPSRSPRQPPVTGVGRHLRSVLRRTAARGGLVPVARSCRCRSG